MDTELLKTFMEVARTRHFGRAAENLYLTQSAVSFRVRQLEGILGVELFSRQRNNIRLTLAGERLFPLAEGSLLLEQRIRQEVALAEGQQETLSLAATPNLWDACLQQMLIALMREQPSLSVNAGAHSGGTLVRQLLERTLDLAIVFDSPKVDELTTVPLFEIELHLVASKSCDDWQQAMALGYVLVDWGISFQMQHAQQFIGASPSVLQTNSGRIALECLLQNGGAAYLPLSLFHEFETAGALHRISTAPIMNRVVYASYLKERPDPEKITDVIQRIRQHPLLGGRATQPEERID